MRRMGRRAAAEVAKSVLYSAESAVTALSVATNNCRGVGSSQAWESTPDAGSGRAREARA